MSYTAYLHPKFAEELSLLPPSLRLRFYTDIMMQQVRGPTSETLETHSPFGATDRIFSAHTHAHLIGHAPKFILCFDTKAMNGGFIYLALSPEIEDAAFCDIVGERLDSLSFNECEAVLFDDYLVSQADPEESKRARSVHHRIALQQMNERKVQRAMEKATTDAAIIFNLHAPQMDRLLIRFDYFFSILQQKLQENCGSAVIEINFPGTEPRSYRSLKDLMQDQLDHSGP